LFYTAVSSQQPHNAIRKNVLVESQRRYTDKSEATRERFHILEPIDPKLFIRVMERATKRLPTDALRGPTPLKITLIGFVGRRE
jgi:hypothetical protein